MNAYDVRVVTPPTQEPISLDDARQHLRLDTYGSPPVHDDDAWLEAFIPAAREICEAFTGRSFAPQTFEVTFAEFPRASIHPGYYYLPAAIALPMPPLIGNVQVLYSDSGAAPVTLDAAGYFVDGSSLYPAYGTSWPTIGYAPGAVRIRYDAGFSLAGESPYDRPLPSRYRSAMLLVLADLYENRNGSTPNQRYELPFGVQVLLGFNQARNGFA